MVEIELNKKIYSVNNNEFPLLKNGKYSTLILRPMLAVFEKEIGLINDLTKCFNSIFINYGTTHGGFVPISIDCDKKIILTSNTDINHLINLDKNIKQHNIDITTLDDECDLDINDNQVYVLRYENSKYGSKVFGDNIIILSYKKLELAKYNEYELTDSSVILYIPDKLNDVFKNEFRYYFNNNRFEYDNLINLCIMVKNAGDNLRDVLQQNLPYIDRWTILDTGSTDNTIDIIKDVLKDKNGDLYCEPFINFRDSRNRCLDLAGRSCKYNIMLDDTYILKGDVRKFLNYLRSDQFGDSYSIMVKSYDMVYGSNRITKTENKLRYVYKLHEIIQTENNKCVQIPFEEMNIYDYSNEYMEERTTRRKDYDIKVLKQEIKDNPNIPRHLYYIAQTYKEMKEYKKAVKYYQKRTEHSVEGYDEEVYDSYLLWGYVGHTELNYEWEDVMKLYMKSYEYKPSRPDALYFIGEYYLKNNNFQLAYQYLKKAFEIGYPVDSGANLRPDLYNVYLPQLLAKVCYELKDYTLGQKACERHLSYRNNETMLSFYKLFIQLNKSNRYEIKRYQDRKILCFVADGGFKKWQGSSIYKEGLGGSETYIVEMSRQIVKLVDMDVYVFCNCEEEETFEGVYYRHLDTYVDFINKNSVDTSIISRYSEYVPVSIENNIKNVFLVVHDLTPSGNIIPMNITKIFCMTNWHKQYFLNYFPMMKEKVEVFPNGINVRDYDVKEEKVRNSFIYSSFPNRGLINLLKMFPKIRKRLPDATLNVFCDTKNSFVQSVSKQEMDEVDKLLEEQKEYITNHGWVSKKVLQEYWKRSEIWLYPCTFQETFCITALEAGASKTLAIATDLAGLNDTIGDRGILISGDPRSEEWQDMAIDKLMENRKRMDELLESNRRWAEEYDWEKIAIKFVEMYIKQDIKLRDGRLEMLNWTNDVPSGSKIIFENVLNNFKDRNCHILEIGTYVGTSVIGMLNYLPNASATVIDMWKNYSEDIFDNNVRISNMENRITKMKGSSNDILMKLVKNGSKYDFIYVDGSHKCLDCYMDLILSWELLKDNGILGIDDYLWGTERDILDRPYNGIEYFLQTNVDRYIVLNIGYRVFLQKK